VILTGIVIQIVFSWALRCFPPIQKILSTAPVAKEIHFLAGFGILLIFGMEKITVMIFQSRDAMHHVSTGINV